MVFQLANKKGNLPYLWHVRSGNILPVFVPLGVSHCGSVCFSMRVSGGSGFRNGSSEFAGLPEVLGVFATGSFV